jgi:hypothetical protein
LERIINMYFRIIVVLICAQLCGIISVQNADAELDRPWDIAACARMATVAVLLENIARQPEAADTLIYYSLLYLGEYNNKKKPSTDLSAARLRTVAAGCKAIALQPEAAADILSTARLFCGPALAPDRYTPEVMKAYMEAVGSMLSAVVQNPAAVDAITDFFDELTSKPQNNPS